MYTVIKVLGHYHVLVDTVASDQETKANYLKTGKALCGVLRKNETLEQFLERKR